MGQLSFNGSLAYQQQITVRAAEQAQPVRAQPLPDPVSAGNVTEIILPQG